MTQILVVAHDGFGAILNQVTQEPEAKGCITIFLDHVKLRVIRGSAHLASLAHNEVYTLVKVCLQCWEGGLSGTKRKKKKEKVSVTSLHMNKYKQL